MGFDRRGHERFVQRCRVDLPTEESVGGLGEWNFHQVGLVRINPILLQPGSDTKPDDVVARVGRDPLADEVACRLDVRILAGIERQHVGRLRPIQGPSRDESELDPFLDRKQDRHRIREGGLELTGRERWEDGGSTRRRRRVHLDVFGLEIAELERGEERRHVDDRHHPDAKLHLVLGKSTR